MNKNGLLGMIFIIVVAVVLLTGTAVYFKFVKGGVQVSAGDRVITINYNLSKNTSQEAPAQDQSPDTESSSGFSDSSISIVERLNTTEGQLNASNNLKDSFDDTLEFQNLSSS